MRKRKRKYKYLIIDRRCFTTPIAFIHLINNITPQSGVGENLSVKDENTER